MKHCERKDVSMLNKLFSVEKTKTHKIFTIFGLKIKFKRKNHMNKQLHNQTYNLQQWISNEVFAANYIKSLHEKTFPQFKDCNKDKEVVIVATGPTMKNYQPIENAIHIGINRAFRRKEIPLDYIFTIDYSGEKFVDEILEYPNAKKFIGISTMKHDSQTFLQKCAIPLHYYNHDNVYPYASDYPRNLGYPDLSHFGLLDFGSTAHSAFHFALYTHPKKIYLVGCDCSGGGYFINGSKQRIDAKYMVEGWEKLEAFWQQYYPDVEVISINPVNLKGLFKDIYTDANKM